MERNLSAPLSLSSLIIIIFLSYIGYVFGSITCHIYWVSQIIILLGMRLSLRFSLLRLSLDLPLVRITSGIPDNIFFHILHAVYITNRSPTVYLGGIAPLQFCTKQPTDLSHMRVFGSPAQIFVRATARNDTKLSNRSVTGTFVGISDKSNGYTF